MTYRVLDVGCGVRPKGDVNLDLYIHKTEHRGFQTEINPKKIRNFVLGDALHLPFRTKGFNHVYSHHVIEHVSDPRLFLKEVIRVAKRKVIIITPHRYARSKFSLSQLEAHTHFFNVKWFHKALRNYQHEIETTTRPLPHLILPLIHWLDEIKVTIYL